MAILENQLQTWAKQGAIQSSEATKESIYKALSHLDSPVSKKGYELYLQGSYRNSTNIRGDSDVDVVAQLNDTFQYDITKLPDDQKTAFRSAFPDADYGWTEFRRDCLAALRKYYDPNNVKPSNKCLKINPPSIPLPADVVPCSLYRKYKSFLAHDNQDYVPGIQFYAVDDKRWIINYPKEHYSNGVKKMDATGNWFKLAVRMLKNARTYMIDRGVISESLAPSYFLECLIYNVPDEKFGESHQATYRGIVDWLIEADMSKFVCQNWQFYLFGNSEEQWNLSDARLTVSKLIELWNNWR